MLAICIVERLIANFPLVFLGIVPEEDMAMGWHEVRCLSENWATASLGHIWHSNREPSFPSAAIPRIIFTHITSNKHSYYKAALRGYRPSKITKTILVQENHLPLWVKRQLLPFSIGQQPQIDANLWECALGSRPYFYF
jgi:hypothetical protein